jgi:hypothetical protein
MDKLYRKRLGKQVLLLDVTGEIPMAERVIPFRAVERTNFTLINIELYVSLLSNEAQHRSGLWTVCPRDWNPRLFLV